MCKRGHTAILAYMDRIEDTPHLAYMSRQAEMEEHCFSWTATPSIPQQACSSPFFHLWKGGQPRRGEYQSDWLIWRWKSEITLLSMNSPMTTLSSSPLYCLRKCRFYIVLENVGLNLSFNPCDLWDAWCTLYGCCNTYMEEGKDTRINPCPDVLFPEAKE